MWTSLKKEIIHTLAYSAGLLGRLQSLGTQEETWQVCPEGYSQNANKDDQIREGLLVEVISNAAIEVKTPPRKGESCKPAERITHLLIGILVLTIRRVVRSLLFHLVPFLYLDATPINQLLSWMALLPANSHDSEGHFVLSCVLQDTQGV